MLSGCATNQVRRGHVEKVRRDATRGRLRSAAHVTASQEDSLVDWSFSTGDGPWAVVPYIASNFTASGSMTWAVEEGDVVTYAYSVRGKTITVAFTLKNYTIGGTPSQDLRLAIPLGLISKRHIDNPVFLIDNSVRQIGLAVVLADSTTIAIQKTDLSNWTPVTNNGFIAGQVTFEVQ